MLELIDELAVALEEVSQWIDGWSPPFIYDDEWPETAHKIKAALEKVKGTLQ